METNKSSKIVSGVLGIWAILATGLWLSAQQQLKESELQYGQMEAHSLVLERQVLELEIALEKAEANSIDRIAEDANRLLFEGWDSLLEEFKQRLEETKDKLNPDSTIDESHQHPEKQT